MLRRSALVSVGAALLGLAATTTGAWAQEEEKEDAVREPERLTVGIADQYLGQLSPGGALLFVSNRNTTTEIYTQDLVSGSATLLFDEGADVSWPRVSPDGQLLLYLSHRDDSAGQLCVRALSGGGERRCLDDGASAVQAEWIGARRIGVVSRASVQSDLRVVSVDVGDRRLTGRPLVERNLSSPAFSPDGRWMLYVPVERYSESVGSAFAARAAQRLEAVRLDRPGPPVQLSLNVPGWTGQPVFSSDGRYLYFAQFYNDSNHDGVVDASDNGVLFRVPFEIDRDDAPARAAVAAAEQLTDSKWNCHYPAPSPKQLVATCARGGRLNLYALPLDGAVPREWAPERLRLEIELSSHRREQLLLRRHLLQREESATARRSERVSLILLHFEFDEFDAAEHYARQIAADPEPSTAGLPSVLLVWIEHRRSLRARERGRVDLDFLEESRARIAKLAPEAPGSPTAVALRRVVRSEIADAMGDKEAAQRELEATPLGGVALLPVLEAYYDRADALYRELDDREALVAACLRLADHPAHEDSDRFWYARAAVRAMVRGLPLAEAEAVLAKARARPHVDAELAGALELGQAVLGVRGPETPRAQREAMAALYRRQPRLDRKRALVLDVVQRADEQKADNLIEVLAQLYIDDVPPGTRERRRAERLFRRVMLGRAYRRAAKGRLDGARDDFALVGKTTGSFESHMGYLELRLQGGGSAGELLAEYARRGEKAPITRFVRAYLAAHRLPELKGEAHTRAVDGIVAELRAAWPELRHKLGVQALYGSVLHDRFTRGGDLNVAQLANTRYLIALDMAKGNPRKRAMVLQQLSLLHAQVGNHRIALGYFEDRDQLPFGDSDEIALAHHLMKARTLLHLNREGDAATAADQAVALVERSAPLGPYRLLALDRAALYNLAAARFERALSLYDTALPLATAATGEGAARNRLVMRLARAAAALGAHQPRRALEDLALIDRQLDDGAVRTALRWPHATVEEVTRAYRLIATGLRARAHRALGELDASARALEARRALLDERLLRSHLDEHVRALALVEAQLAEVAWEAGDLQRAAGWVRSALGHSDTFLRRTGIPLDTDQLDLLWFAAELRLAPGVRLKFKTGTRVRDAHARLVSHPDPAWRSYRRLFAIYSALLSDPTKK